MDREQVIVLCLLVFAVLVFLAFKFRPVGVENSVVNCDLACEEYFCVSGYYDSNFDKCSCEPAPNEFVDIEQMLFFYDKGFAC